MRHKNSGFTLIELVIFVIIVSVGVVGILAVFQTTVAASAAPFAQKQAHSIADSLLEEIELQPYTYCDPQDPSAATATSAAGCTIAENMGPETGQTRSGASTFNNVNDYDGYSMNPLVDIAGTTISALNGYKATVSEKYVGATLFGFADNTSVLQIDVRVQAPATKTDITITGYRFRYAPNALP